NEFHMRPVGMGFIAQCDIFCSPSHAHQRSASQSFGALPGHTNRGWYAGQLTSDLPNLKKASYHTSFILVLHFSQATDGCVLYRCSAILPNGTLSKYLAGCISIWAAVSHFTRSVLLP